MTLTDLLSEHKKSLLALIDLLNAEIKTLSAGAEDMSLLETLAQKKKPICSHIESLEVKRLLLISDHGFSKDREGSTQSAEYFDCLDLWNETHDLISECARLNMVSGDISRRIMTQNATIIDALSRMTGQQVYDSKGNFKQANSRLNITA